MLKNQDVLREVLSRRDPSGYYVLISVKNNEAEKVVLEFKEKSGVIVEDYGGSIIIRCKSRSIAESIARKLLARNLLVFEK